MVYMLCKLNIGGNQSKNQGNEHKRDADRVNRERYMNANLPRIEHGWCWDGETSSIFEILDFLINNYFKNRGWMTVL